MRSFYVVNFFYFFHTCNLERFCRASNITGIELIKAKQLGATSTSGYHFLRNHTFGGKDVDTGFHADECKGLDGDYIQSSSPYDQLLAQKMFQNFKSINIADDLLQNHAVFKMKLHKIHFYLRLAEQSIELISAPGNNASDHFKACLFANINMFQHQHAVELWMPFLLRHHPSATRFVVAPYESIAPLFYFVVSHHYTASWCHSNSTAGREDTNGFGNEHLAAVGLFLRNLTCWKATSGSNFIFATSHPQGPQPPEREIGNASYLVVDNDAQGRSWRDYIVPYVSDYDPSALALTISSPRPLLLSFVSWGVGPTRPHVLKELKNVTRLDVVIVDGRLPDDIYFTKLQQSKFCLSVSGHTSSSRRLFGAIQAGCVPVIISDKLIPPYNSILNYSTFTVRIGEADVMRNASIILEVLENVSSERLRELQENLLVVRHFLRYDTWHYLNPVSLVLIEVLLRNIEKCKNEKSSYVCEHLHRRMLKLSRSKSAHF